MKSHGKGKSRCWESVSNGWQWKHFLPNLHTQTSPGSSLLLLVHVHLLIKIVLSVMSQRASCRSIFHLISPTFYFWCALLYMIHLQIPFVNCGKHCILVSCPVSLGTLNMNRNNGNGLKEINCNHLWVGWGLTKQNPVNVYVSTKSFIERSRVRGGCVDGSSPPPNRPPHCAQHLGRIPAAPALWCNVAS